MSERNNLLHQLSNLLRWKESKAFYANKLNISLEELNELLSELKSAKVSTVNRTDKSDVQRSLTQKGLGKEYFVAGGWVKENDMSIRFSKKQEKEVAQHQFTEFLKTFKPKQDVIIKSNHQVSSYNSCLVLNIQDAHYNKYDINGKNNIHKRFADVNSRISEVVKHAAVNSNLNKVIYVLGSDIFNSEWTDTTTKGTPQSNISSYQESFKDIAQHEVDVLELLSQYSDNIHVMYCPGNHDEFVGWHLMHWLQMYFRNQSNITFDISPTYTKYIKFSNTAMCFNHGDGAKPEVMAKNFPFAFKDQWSKCEHFVIFGGDKHTDLSRDLGGIQFYRIPALSTAQSKWDSKNGYEGKAQLTAFLINEDGGMNIIKRPI